MTLSELLASLHPAVVTDPEPDSIPTNTTETARLFFSVSDGKQRAKVVHSRGPTAAIAWQQGAHELQALCKREDIKPRWLRLDRVERITEMTWGELAAQLQRHKRNYFRHGISLDADCRLAFLETELNANAMLYGGVKVPHATLNEKNFRRYAKLKFSNNAEPEFGQDQSVWTFTTRGWLADDKGQVHPLHSEGRNTGRRQIDTLTSGQVYELIDDASAFLAHQVKPGGAFVYGIHPCFNRTIKAYNALRHASTTYAMLEAWELTGDANLKQAIDRSLNYLSTSLIQQRALPGGEQASFLVDVGGEIKLGGNAVCLLALVKYTELTGDLQFRELMHELGVGIEYMQHDHTGQFDHVLHAEDLSVKQAFRIIYYDGEAAFGLMRLYGLTRDGRWLACVERAFEYFIANDHWQAHDHWLSYCVNELTVHRPDARYYEFGLKNVADYLDFVLERITTYPTLLELMMAAHKMIVRLQNDPEHRHLLQAIDLEKFYRALEFRAHYLLNGHFWPELAMYFARPSSVLGSFFIRHHSFRVRIDDVEHYLSGFVAYHQHYLSSVTSSSVQSDQSGPSRPAGAAEPTRHYVVSANFELETHAARSFEIMRTAAMLDGVEIVAISGGENRVLARLDQSGTVAGWLERFAFDFGWRHEMQPARIALTYAVKVSLGDQGKRLDDYRGRLDADDGWSEQVLASTTHGRWLMAPADNWRATGLSITATTVRPGNLVVLRPEGGKRGLTLAQIQQYRDRIGGVLVEDQLDAVRGVGLPLLLVPNVSSAILKLGFRARDQFQGHVVGVTGSSGKTTACHWLKDLLAGFGPTEMTRQSANLPHGLAWNLCSMSPKSAFHVLELAIGGMGVNSLMSRPEIAIVLNISDAHLTYHRTRAEIADKKARIVLGMAPGSILILNADMPERSTIEHAAAESQVRVVTFGCAESADYRLLGDNSETLLRWSHQGVERAMGIPFSVDPLKKNLLACIIVLDTLQCDLSKAADCFSQLALPDGRGSRRALTVKGKSLTIFDESYNANPDSMRAALAGFRSHSHPENGQSWLVLGDMLELGQKSSELHRALIPDIVESAPDHVLLVGEQMGSLCSSLVDLGCDCRTFDKADGLAEILIDSLQSGDRCLIKSSHGSGLHRLVTRLKQAAD